MKVCRRTPEQEAWQYNGAVELAPAWVKSSVIERNGELLLDRLSGRQLIKLGEWLVRDLDGDPLWLPSSDFQKEYKVVG